MISNVLVTGGVGFIGTHLCRSLVNSGRKVKVLDLRKPETRMEGVDYIQGDVRDPVAVQKALEGQDAVFHFAAIVSVPLCQEKPIESYQTNLLATVQLLELIRKQDAGRPRARFLFAGSSAVYGNTLVKGTPRNESEVTASPVSFYGAQKLGSEQAIQIFNQSDRIPAVIFRFFNVFGPGQDPRSPYSGVMSIFALSTKEGRALRLNGKGEPTRDFVSVHDVVSACMRALEIPDESCDGVPINLGSGQAISIRQLANEIISTSGKAVSLEDMPFREGDVMHSLADISRAEKVLGWKPQVSLQQGLKEIL